MYGHQITHQAADRIYGWLRKNALKQQNLTYWLRAAHETYDQIETNKLAKVIKLELKPHETRDKKSAVLYLTKEDFVPRVLW